MLLESIRFERAFVCGFENHISPIKPFDLDPIFRSQIKQPPSYTMSIAQIALESNSLM
jgi:hypothetical protein